MVILGSLLNTVVLCYTFQSIFSRDWVLSEELVEFLDSMTMEELQYHVRRLEDYVYDQSSKTYRFGNLFSGKRSNIMKYINDVIFLHQNSLKDLKVFKEKIKIFENLKTPKQIITQSSPAQEKGFLTVWAANAEKYERKKNNMSYLLGGIRDYGNYLSKEDLKRSIMLVIEANQELSDMETFKQNILNINKKFHKGITPLNYLFDKERDELIPFLVQLEFYMRDYKKVQIPPEIMTSRDKLFTSSKEEILKMIMDYLKKNEEVQNIENFIKIIEYKNLSYVPPLKVLEKQPREDLISLSLACEKYVKKSEGRTRSLKNLTEYVRLIPSQKLKNYIIQQFDKYPELEQKSRLKDIDFDSKNSQIGLIEGRIRKMERDKLIQLYLNLNLLAKDETLENVLYLPDKVIQRNVMEIISSNSSFYSSFNFIDAGTLYHFTLKSLVETKPRTVMLDILTAINDYHKRNIDIYYDDLTEADRAKLSDEELSNRITKMSETYSISTPTQFRDKIGIEEAYPLYGSLLDYLRSINNNKLKKFLILLEKYIKKKKKYTNVIGGSSELFTDENYIKKPNIISLIMKYAKSFPELQDAYLFTKITETRSGVYNELLERRESNEVFQIACKLDEYRRVVMNQIEFNEEYFKDKYVYKHKDASKYLFFVFKVISMLPELNISVDMIKILKEPSIIYNVTEFLKSQDKAQLNLISHNLKKYHNARHQTKDITNIDILTKRELELYVEKKIKENEQLKNPVAFARVVRGLFEYFFFDNYETFLNRQSSEVIKVIYDNIVQYVNRTNSSYAFTESNVTEEKMKEEIIKTVNGSEELKNFSFFQEEIDKVQLESEQEEEIYQKLITTSRTELEKFALGAEIMIRNQRMIESFGTIFEVVHYASRNELIRYILKGFRYYRLYRIKNLEILCERNNLNYGENSILYFTES